MPSIDARLAELTEALRGLTTAVESSETERKKDHDALIRLTEQVNNLGEVVSSIRADRKEQQKSSLSRIWQVSYIILAAVIGAAASWFVTELRGK